MSLPKVILIAGAISLAMAGACPGQTLRSDSQNAAKTTKPAKRTAPHAMRPPPGAVARDGRAFATEPPKPIAPPERYEDRGGGGGGGGGM